MILLMRRDSIFYALFKRSPSLLFELLSEVPDTAAQYRFESVAVKEPTFMIDGVFLPPETDPPGTVFFAEVQMQKDERLYERLFGESMTHFYRNRDYYSDWQTVLIYPSKSTEQTDTHPYRALLNSDQVHRIYLDELGAIEDLPLGVASMVLTIAKDSEAPEKAKMLIGRALQEVDALPARQGIIEMVSTIITYKFTNLSRQEIDAMLGTKFEETRVYQETRQEERQAIALKMLRKSMSVETIAEITELTIAQIQELQGQLN
jgi:predicted transposase/invertase (TIGR01784 family)